MGLLQALYLFLRASVISHGTLAAENLALRQQLSVLTHTCTRPKLRPRDCVFWVWLSRLLPDWRSVLRIVQPDTVIKWHQQGFKLYWRWKSTPKAAGRPRFRSTRPPGLSPTRSGGPNLSQGLENINPPSA